jgi:hypothetical protein
LPTVTVVDWPGLSVTEEEERDVLHPEGALDATLNVSEEHPELSLSVTVTE